MPSDSPKNLWNRQVWKQAEARLQRPADAHRESLTVRTEKSAEVSRYSAKREEAWDKNAGIRDNQANEFSAYSTPNYWIRGQKNGLSQPTPEKRGKRYRGLRKRYRVQTVESTEGFKSLGPLGLQQQANLKGISADVGMAGMVCQHLIRALLTQEVNLVAKYHQLSTLYVNAVARILYRQKFIGHRIYWGAGNDG